jgi:protein TonB
MMRPIEALVFLSLAGGAHVALWSVAPEQSGASADGAAAAVTLAAAPVQAALARAWQAAPDRAEAATPLPSPTAPDRVAALASVTDTRPTLPPVPGLTPVLPAALPQTDTAPPQVAPPPPVPMIRPAPTGQTPRRPTAEAPRPAPPAPDRATAQQVDTPVQADRAPPPRPKPPAAPPKPASAGATAKSGSGGRDAAQSAQPVNSDRLRARWGAQIQTKVHRRLIYPRGAKGSGTAKVALTVDRSGRLTGVKLVHSSGTPAFDDAALNAVRRAGRFPAAPAELTSASYGFTLSLAFRP